MSSYAPIGVFDSGLGGLSVVRQIRHDLPHERILYVADSKRAPYGVRSKEEIIQFSIEIADSLVAQGVKAIVIACNTATAAAVNILRERYSIPIIGMEPALKVAVDRGAGTRQHIVVAATPLTLREHKFAQLLERFNDDHTIAKQPCPDLVTLVESGQLYNHDLVMQTLHRYFDQYDYASLDSIVLGCTHFVFFKPYFEELVESHTAILDGNKGTVRHLAVVLESLGKLADESQQGSVHITNSDTSVRLHDLALELLHASHCYE